MCCVCDIYTYTFKNRIIIFNSINIFKCAHWYIIYSSGNKSNPINKVMNN